LAQGQALKAVWVTALGADAAAKDVVRTYYGTPAEALKVIEGELIDTLDRGKVEVSRYNIMPWLLGQQPKGNRYGEIPRLVGSMTADGFNWGSIKEIIKANWKDDGPDKLDNAMRYARDRYEKSIAERRARQALPGPDAEPGPMPGPGIYSAEYGSQQESSAIDETDEANELDYEYLSAYSMDIIPLLQTSTAVDFGLSAAKILSKNHYYKQGTGFLYYNGKTGTWERDWAEKWLGDYLTRMTKLYRDLWESSPDKPAAVKRMCLNLESTGYIQREIQKPMESWLYLESARFDHTWFMLNCGGVAVDLRTGKKRHAVPGDYFTKSTAFQPGDPDKAVCFCRFLLEVCGGDESKAAWVLRWFCRAAAGGNFDSYILNLEGGGGNGKSVIQNLFLKVYGNYGMVLPQELVIKGEGCSEAARALQGLEGVRYGTLPDCGKGTLRLSELKRISGNDAVQSRALHQERITFIPCISIVIGSNTPLYLNETNEAIQRRLKTLGFNWVGKSDRLLPGRL
jgi:hypothetical protein